MAEQHEVDSFLKDLGIQEESILDKPLTEETIVPEKETAEEESFKNRAYRRLEKRYQAERESGIAMAERIKVLSEVDKFKEDIGNDHLKKVDAIFGTDTPEKLAATNILKEALQGMTEKAKTDALKEWESRTGEETSAQKEADNEVDDMLEHVEDDYGLDMSDDKVRSGFITLMEKMSSKYDDGNIKEFADANSVAETYLALQKRGGSSRAKELAGRSMTHSGESQPSKLPQNAIDRYMVDNGLAW